MPSVLQEWVTKIPMMQQTVLLTCVRGPDNVHKYHTSKYLLRWYRRCVLMSSMDHQVILDPADSRGGSFMGPSLKISRMELDDIIGIEGQFWWCERMNKLVDDYLRELDAVPHHFTMHFMHGAEILGYKHPSTITRSWWYKTYNRLVKDFHLLPEPESVLNERLGDNRDNWLKHSDPATAE